RDGIVRRWEAETGKKLPPCEGHQGAVISVTFAPNGQTLASAGEDQTVRLWDTATAKLLRTCIGHRDLAVAVAFAPDGKTLVSRGTDSTIRLWDAGSGKAVRLWQCPTQAVTPGTESSQFFAFLSDGKTVAAGSSRGIRLYDATTGEEARYIAGPP